MDRDQAAQDRFDPRVHETGLADHGFEFRHGRKTADRFDQVAIAVRVPGNGRAQARDQVVRIGVIDFLEAGPFGGREFQAVEPSAMLQHAVGFGQGLVDVGDVPDAESDGIGIEEAVRKSQDFGILARPDQAIQPAFQRAFDADVQHVLVDVGHGDRRAARGHAKGDVARSARHVEDLLARLRLYAADELVLPQPVHACRHRIVHHVVLLRDGREHGANLLGLLLGRDLVVTEGYLFAHGPRLSGKAGAVPAKACLRGRSKRA